MPKNRSNAAGKAATGLNRLASSLPRRRKATRSQKRQYSKKVTSSYQPVQGGFSTAKQVFMLWRSHWRILAGIVSVYGLLNLFLASGLTGIGNTFESVKVNFEETGKDFSAILDGFGSLLGSTSSTTSETASVLQSTLLVIESLVIIWALRHLLAGQAIKVKEAYYNASAPLVPFLLVLALVILQLLPLLLGSTVVYNLFSGIAGTSAVVTIIALLIVLALAVWSVYMLSASIFALYIVTLPEMQPRKALRSAKNLVRFRRWLVIRRLLVLPVILLLIFGIVVLPLMLWINFLVVPVVFILSMLAVLFVHSYLYSLYRGLLG